VSKILNTRTLKQINKTF